MSNLMIPDPKPNKETDNLPEDAVPFPSDPTAPSRKGMNPVTSVLPKRDNGHHGKNGPPDSHSEATASLGDNREVILLIRGMVERIVMSEGVVYRLGRFELEKALTDVDLIPYGAIDRGVSRIHARLHLEEGRLYVTDLNSSNGTYIGMNKLIPNNPVPLRKGDELRLGRLSIQVLFR